ncbi:hypothetical protein [Aureibacillus halotolerans]|uniref:Uncharacterized protein n=1 Tax=Aureibacillus halotolerans TaxID=1508390 RepID=A0A4R6U6W0_9BACI|nr:hypothetical protein [Aureibacillus halotolerans]TDQ38774.1 hypothetical protein EV213_109143 [Aureibacillus halotolerans]
MFLYTMKLTGHFAWDEVPPFQFSKKDKKDQEAKDLQTDKMAKELTPHIDPEMLELIRKLAKKKK